jgi:hypothetical protein
MSAITRQVSEATSSLIDTAATAYLPGHLADSEEQEQARSMASRCLHARFNAGFQLPHHPARRRPFWIQATGSIEIRSRTRLSTGATRRTGIFGFMTASTALLTWSTASRVVQTQILAATLAFAAQTANRRI